MLTSRITEGEKRNFKTNLKQTPITIMVTLHHYIHTIKCGFLVVFYFIFFSFTHFKWLTFKELI